MTADAVRISMVNVEIPVTLPPPKRRRRADAAEPEPEVMSLEIYADSCRVWAPFADIECGQTFEFNPASGRRMTDIPCFPQLFKLVSEQCAANRCNPPGAFLRSMVVAMEAALAERDGACVYFAQADDRVKIGWSKRVASRIAELQTGNPSPLKLLGVVPGARAMERQIHERFAHLRLSGEWFRAAPDLLAYIAQPTP